MSRRPNTIVDRRVDVLAVFALELESAPLLRMLLGQRATTGSGFHVVEGSFGGRRLAVATIGSTGSRREAALDALESVHKPRWLVSAGFAVGLADEVRTGEIVLASELTDEQGNSLSPNYRENRPLGKGRLHVGRCISMARLPVSTESKRAAGKERRAMAADRQSFVLARFCAKRGVRFAALRVVVEDTQRDSAPGTRTIYHPSGSFRAGGWVGALLGGSGRVARLMTLRSEAKQHAERLADALTHLLPRLT
jgi:adenosylhomocysteine nucleosidase